jgi:putative transposase
MTIPSLPSVWDGMWYSAPHLTKEFSGTSALQASSGGRGVRIARKRVARLMKENGIRPPRRRKRPPITTDSRHGYGIAPNLLQRAFEADRPNTIWLADITYVATDEGWLYLAAVKDMATREIVGWSMADHLRSSLCENALMMAIQHRAPPRGLIHHSDRGVQGGFKRSSQHPDKGGCDEEAEAAFGSVWAGCSSIARPAPRGAA